ncbi:MAG: VCBS repeat-containing protein [Synechococcales cyanobacterium C42_A2020_086]|jgi:Ca2+-binding RTX toxin-like protein|nr:VCBS repeat-containing protein [Synechococcales cyanobacterium C42_A2020_086]
MSVRFNSATTFPVSRNSNSVAIADLDGDGNLDILTGGPTVGSPTPGLTALLGNGAGQFGAPIVSSGQVGAANALAVGDFNNDRRLDVITVGSFFSASDVFVSLGDGRGRFTPTTSIAVGNNPQSLAVGDINRDNRLDAVTANSGGRTISVLLGDGRGGFSVSTIPLDSSPKAVELRDFNGDGQLDIAAVTVTETPGVLAGTAKLSVLLGNGTGVFTPVTAVDLGEVFPSAADMTVADFNGDGRVDIAALIGGNISILLSDPVQLFRLSYRTPQTASSLTTGDFNGDGRLDLATNAFGSDFTAQATVLLGNGSGGFSRPVPFPVTSGSFILGGSDSITAADLNKDNKLDLVSVTPAFTDVSVLFNTTTGTDALALGETFVDASSELGGSVRVDLRRNTLTLRGATPLNLRLTDAVVDVVGTVQNDQIRGDQRRNLLNGSAGNDTLLGFNGNDRLVGGAGNDRLEGGRGRDRFIFSATPNYPEGLNIPFSRDAMGIDRIVDFERGRDKIVLDAGTFTALEAGRRVSFATVNGFTAAKRSSALITYVRSSGKLYYNQNGSRPGFGTGGQFAVLTEGLALSASDFAVFA